jgi:hypothetical protein
MRSWFAVVLPIVAGAGEARAGAAGDPAFCDDVRLVVAAARADPPFSTLPPRIFEQGHRLFGFAWPCAMEDGGRTLRCRQYVTYEREAETMAAETASCLPEARRDLDESSAGDDREGRRQTFPYYRARFRLPDLIIEISRAGYPANHLGQFVTYRLSLNQPD